MDLVTQVVPNHYTEQEGFRRIRTIITEKEANLARLDAEISRLLEERLAERQSLSAHKVLMAPVRRLPLELLSEIFVSLCLILHVVNEYSLRRGWIKLRCLGTHDFVLPNTRQAPILLTQVCKAWRTVALSTPKLWSSINLGLFSIKHKSRPYIPSLMDNWLNRSALLPLSISLGLHSDDPVSGPALEVLFRHIRAWKHVRLEWCMQNLPIPPLFNFNFCLSSNAPFLETFELRTEGGLGTQGEEHLSAILRGASALCRFSWADEDLSLDLNRLILPWAQLSDLDLRCKLSLRDCITLLHVSPNLVSCSFHLVRLDSPASTLPQGQITLPHLRHLSIDSVFTLTPLLDSVTLPALLSLEATSSYDTDNAIPPWPHAEFVALLTRSSPPLANLHLRAPISEDQLIAVLERTSGALRVLNVDGGLSREPCVTDNILTLLTLRSSSANENGCGELVCLAPKLKSMTLHRCMKFNRTTGISAGVLANMIESRWRASLPSTSEVYVARPEYFELTLSASAVSMDDVTRLDTMRKEGLDLQFSYTS